MEYKNAYLEMVEETYLSKFAQHVKDTKGRLTPIPPCPLGSHRADRKLLQKIRQKKIAMGHKPDDHEEEQNMGGMTMGGM